MPRDKKQFPIKRVAIGCVVATLLLIMGMFSTSIFETNEAGYMQVKQAAVTGDLSVRSEPGMYFQNFGAIHTYKEASTFSYTPDGVEGARPIGTLPTRYNDGTQAKISGSVRVVLPMDEESLIQIHRKFKSMDGVMGKLVLPALRKAILASGPHMSAAESYSARRAEFMELVEDQLINGVIKTDQVEEETIDEITKEKTTVLRLTKRRCETENGLTCVAGFERQVAVCREFMIDLTNFVIDEINYPKQVLEQIETQRKARMNIITVQAQAQEAEARAKKAKSEAEAAIEETRAKEEIAKTQRTVKAEADKEVARLAKDAAAYKKQELTLLGEGEAARKRLVMQADGALAQKLAAWVKAQEVYANALSNAKPGALVPYMIMGGTGNKSSNATNFIDLFTAKAAKDLSLDFGVKSK
jgi:regulator of protease activity HflC (stomatin/prohibitin superfamily)